MESRTKNGKTTSYEYNVDGLRTRKTNPDGTYSDYYWVGSMLLAEQQCKADGTVIRTLRFLYDEKNSPIGFDIRVGTSTSWTSYYYAKNLQGDVTALYAGIYVSEGVYSPSLVATYDYDPWGKILAVKDANGNTIPSANTTYVANLNPYRYRGYYYDTDTGFYYLRSRYYDPQICRFINADTYASTGQGFVGCNMFVYCNNSPIYFEDSNGTLTKGQIHNYALRGFAAQRDTLTTQDTCIYYNKTNCWGGWGFCDMYDAASGEVWELKRNSKSWSCSTTAARNQLNKYINGSLKADPDLELKVGSTPFQSGNIVAEDWTGTYYISFWEEGNGVLRYDYTHEKSDLKKAADAVAAGAGTVVTIVVAGAVIYATGGAAAPVVAEAAIEILDELSKVA